MLAGKPSKSKELKRYVASAAVGVLVTLALIFALNGGALLVPHASSPPPGGVLLEGIMTVFSYTNGTPAVFGMVQQHCSGCPVYMAGGSDITFEDVAFVDDQTANASFLVVANATSPVPFLSWNCETVPVGSCPTVFSSSSGVLLGCCGSVTWPVTFVVPNPSPSSPEDWIFYVTVVVTEQISHH